MVVGFRVIMYFSKFKFEGFWLVYTFSRTSLVIAWENKLRVFKYCLSNQMQPLRWGREPWYCVCEWKNVKVKQIRNIINIIKCCREVKYPKDFNWSALTSSLSWKSFSVLLQAFQEIARYSLCTCKSFPVNLTQTLLLSAVIFPYPFYGTLYLALRLLIEETPPSLYRYRRKYTKLVLLPSGRFLNFHRSFFLFHSVIGRWSKWPLVPVFFLFGIL